MQTALAFIATLLALALPAGEVEFDYWANHKVGSWVRLKMEMEAQEGDEEIEVAGKKLKCHWIEGTQKETHKVKFWVSKEIPGGVAKAEISGGDIPGPLKITATSWEKK